MPESFVVEGAAKEICNKKQPRVNRQKEAKKKRATGQEYISPKTKKIVPARQMGDPCTNDGCQKKGCQGRILTNEARLSIFDEFNGLSDLQKQREFIVRHMEITETKAKSTNSRRQKSHTYFLTANGQHMKVCQTLFLRTLGITERMMRTAKGKLSQTGILEPEMRGGRMSEKDRCRDQRIRSEVEIHIDRFPRVESHYCRSSSTKEYLSPELTHQRCMTCFARSIKGQIKQVTAHTAEFSKKKICPFIIRKRISVRFV